MRNIVILILLIFLLWGAGSVYWYVCKIKGLCIESETSTKTTVPDERKGNLTFLFNGVDPSVNEQTPVLFDSLRSLKIDTLLIQGFAFTGESPNTASRRALNIKKLIIASGFDKPIKTASGTKDSNPKGEITAHQFISIKNPVPAAQQEGGGSSSDFEIVKKADKVIILFPVASADPHTNKSL
ncbi:MAG: hypothetical protein AAFO69_04205, partial [Bacteroidota bacterium]